jgi:hypothetical protein
MSLIVLLTSITRRSSRSSTSAPNIQLYTPSGSCPCELGTRTPITVHALDHDRIEFNSAITRRWTSVADEGPYSQVVPDDYVPLMDPETQMRYVPNPPPVQQTNRRVVQPRPPPVVRRVTNGVRKRIFELEQDITLTINYETETYSYLTRANKIQTEDSEDIQS